MTGFQPLVVGEKRAETAGAVTLTLVVPVELRERFRFRPGQYLTLRGEVGSEMLARSYSISSTPSEDGLSLTVKRLPEGRFSTWLVERVEPGMAIEVLPPLGCFTPVPLRYGVAEARIHTEHFAPDGIKAVSRETTPATVSRRSPAVCEVAVLRDGAARRLAVRRGQTGVLEAARATGIDLPQSCIRGVCGTCRAKLVAGRGEMAINHALPAEEVAKGFVLSCQLRPLTPTLTLDFDRAWDRS